MVGGSSRRHFLKLRDELIVVTCIYVEAFAFAVVFRRFRAKQPADTFEFLNKHQSSVRNPVLISCGQKSLGVQSVCVCVLVAYLALWCRFISGSRTIGVVEPALPEQCRLQSRAWRGVGRRCGWVGLTDRAFGGRSGKLF